MSEARALVNMIGNGVAAIVLARWEGELDVNQMHAVLNGKTYTPPTDQPVAKAA
jgi:aerobic C4-dicarboxylate transport protein